MTMEPPRPIYSWDQLGHGISWDQLKILDPHICISNQWECHGLDGLDGDFRRIR